MKKGKDSFYCRYIKRILDIGCALAALLVFCWLYAAVALLVRVKLGSPVIFKQVRIGKDEQPFMMYKFRSMTDARDENGELLPDAEHWISAVLWRRCLSSAGSMPPSPSLSA